MSPVYLDHTATTPLLPPARDAMLAAVGEGIGNPSSAHAAGRKARQLLEDARDRVAALLGADPAEVVFTSGATEANNLAVLGLLGEPRPQGRRVAEQVTDHPTHGPGGPGSPVSVLSSAIEHPCVVEPLRHLATHGVGVTWLPVSPAGIVEQKTVLDHVSPDTRLVSLMLANHETGAIQPVRHVAKTLPKGALVHTDAAQAVGKMPVNFRDLGVTALTASAHKFGGPAGVGLLLVKGGTKLAPRLFGGSQQRGYRPGTEPVALAVGLAAALDHAVEHLAANADTVLSLRTAFLSRLAGVGHVVNGPPVPLTPNPSPAGGEGNPTALPHTLNVSFRGCRSEVLLMALDLAGVACSTGSACSSGSLLPSPVLEAMGVPPDVLASAMRFSFAPSLTVAEVESAADRVGECVKRLRG